MSFDRGRTWEYTARVEGLRTGRAARIEEKEES